MSGPLKTIILPAADADLRRQLAYLDENAGLSTALRFYEAALGSFADLASLPGMGTKIQNQVLPDLRRWRVKGFEKYLIFYRFDEVSVYVIRVLHGAMDVDLILDDEGETQQ